MPDWRVVAAASGIGAVVAGLSAGWRSRRRRPRPFVDEPSAPSPPAPRVGAGLTVAGRYRLVRELGRGATGTVHLADDLQRGGQVALKTLAFPRKLGGADLADARARFFREADAARRLRHPDIVCVWDASDDHGLAFIAMEVLAGTDLVASTRADALLPVETVLRTVARVALALDHAHRLGIVHRDIKPANVMRDPAGDTVKLTDFGTASLVDAERTRTGVLLGTPLYMSPEQMAGGPVDGRSDLFSLGVVLYELLTGSLPYRDGSMADLLRQIAVEPPPDLRDRMPALPEALADVVALALQKRPALRYADGRAFAADLLELARRIETGRPPHGG